MKIALRKNIELSKIFYNFTIKILLNWAFKFAIHGLDYTQIILKYS